VWVNKNLTRIIILKKKMRGRDMEERRKKKEKDLEV